MFVYIILEIRLIYLQFRANMSLPNSKEDITMTINYNVADCIARFLGCEKKYLGAPGFAYQVGYIEVSKDGTITFDDRADSEEVEALLEELEKEGFHAETSAAQEAPLGLTISLPLDKANVGNLTNLLNAKGALISRELLVLSHLVGFHLSGNQSLSAFVPFAL